MSGVYDHSPIPSISASAPPAYSSSQRDDDYVGASAGGGGGGPPTALAVRKPAVHVRPEFDPLGTHDEADTPTRGGPHGASALERKRAKELAGMENDLLKHLDDLDLE